MWWVSPRRPQVTTRCGGREGPEAGAAPARGPSQGVVGLLLQGLSLRRPS